MRAAQSVSAGSWVAPQPLLGTVDACVHAPAVSAWRRCARWPPHLARLAAPLQDPKTPSFQWTEKLKRLMPWLSTESKTLSLQFRVSLIQQALNVAYARHDAVSDYLTVCLAWLESEGQAHLPTLLQQYTVPGGNLTALTADRVYPAPAPGPAEGPGLAPAAAPGSAPARARSQ